jgi:hypothetical protein
MGSIRYAEYPDWLTTSFLKMGGFTACSEYRLVYADTCLNGVSS